MECKLFNIQKFSVHDGPGIRTTVFFKGCNLKCRWCHNPESISKENQIEFYPEKCIGCGACFTVCPNGVHFLDDNKEHKLDRSKCDGCLLCAQTCYAGALAGVGQNIEISQLLQSILEDKTYYDNSSGGVTFSGGEAMLQIDFLEKILKRCKVERIHTAVDTAGCVPWNYFERILESTDLFLYDIKAADPIRHKQLTGAENHLILDNLNRLSKAGKKIWIRVPFIPGQNDDQIEGIAQLLSPLKPAKVEVMAYHKLGNSKYTALDLKNELLDMETPSEEQADKAAAILRSYGLNANRT